MGRKCLNYTIIYKDDKNRALDRILCECGKESIRANLSNHKKSAVHKMYIRLTTKTDHPYIENKNLL